MYPYNFKMGHTIQTDVNDENVDRGFIAHFQVSAENAIAQSITGVLGATALTNLTQIITENISNLLVPRNIKIKGNVDGITGDVVITGTNYLNEEITETLALDGTTEVQGIKAFKTVSQIELPVETNAGTDTVSVGFANKLGLPYKQSLDTVLSSYRDGVKEVVGPTVTVDPDNIELNTILLDSALNGTVIDTYLIV